MSAVSDELLPDEDLADLLPDDLLPVSGNSPGNSKGNAKQLALTPKQKAAQKKRAQRAEEKAALDARNARDAAAAQRLAQVVNLFIAGHSLADIGASIGASADEVDRMLAQDAQRYVRTQPQLRQYVRNWISGKYTQLLEADWDEATDKTSPHKLENQDRVLKILREMDRLHGAAAPTQTEVKIDAAPESVQKMVDALAQSHGLGYDAAVFDAVEQIVEAELVHEAPAAALAALEQSSRLIDQAAGDDQNAGEGF